MAWKWRSNIYKAFFEPRYRGLTMEERKAMILERLEVISESDEYKEHHDYGSLEQLKDDICTIMGWVKEYTVPSRYRGTLGYVATDVNCDKCTETISRMEAQGYIRISKSGKGFKVLKTW